MRSCISSTTDQSIQISQKLSLEDLDDLELLGFSFSGSISSSKVEDSKLPRSSLTKDVFGDLIAVFEHFSVLALEFVIVVMSLPVSLKLSDMTTLQGMRTGSLLETLRGCRRLTLKSLSTHPPTMKLFFCLK